MTVVVIGGGITGLAAARALLAAVGERPVVLIEAEPRLGGKILTRCVDDRPVDAGPEAMLTRRPWAVSLCTDLGLRGQLVAPDSGAVGLWGRRRVHRLPAGVGLGFPVSPIATLRSGVLSARGAVRASADVVLPQRMPADDVSVGSLVRYRYGNEVLERLVEPLLGGVHAGPVDGLSLRATVPHIDAAARRSRSLTLGLRAASRRERASTTGGGAAGPPFVTVRGGLGELVNAIERSIAAAEILVGQPVQRLRRDPDGNYVVDLAERQITAQAVIVAVPAFAAADLLGGISPTTARELAPIGYSSVTTVTLAYPRGTVLPLAGVNGLLAAKSDARVLTGCSFVSAKWSHLRSPDRGPLLRCTVTGARGHDLGDDDLVAALAADLRAAIGLTAVPHDWAVTRWTDALPHYGVGHVDRVARVRAGLPPTLAVAGAAYDGAGIADCIRQGEEAAAQIASALRASESAPR